MCFQQICSLSKFFTQKEKKEKITGGGPKMQVETVKQVALQGIRILYVYVYTTDVGPLHAGFRRFLEFLPGRAIF